MSPVDVTNIEEAEAWSGSVHVYKNINVSSISSNFHVNQMLCCSVVIDALEWLSPDDHNKDERYELATSKIQSLVDDICCSVPYHLSSQQSDHEFSEDSRNIGGEHPTHFISANALC
jgi:hypothetical protein